MSVSRWAYHPDKCDGEYCPGDCDICRKAEEEPETRKECNIDEQQNNGVQ